MPSTSAKQRRFMAAAAHSPAFAKKAGIPQHVAEDFNEEDHAYRQPAIDRGLVERAVHYLEGATTPKDGQ